MTHTDATAQDCDLCGEVVSGGTLYTRSHKPPLPFSRLVAREGDVDVLAGVGALVPGYMVVFPTRHALSVADLDDDSRAALTRVVRRLATMIPRTFGGRVVTVEHGSSGPRERRRPSCIDHAHVHLFPVPLTADLSPFVDGAQRIPSAGGMVPASARETSYIHTLLPDGTEWFRTLREEIPPQSPRRAWTRVLGRDADVEYDWTVFPCIENVTSTLATIGEVGSLARAALTAAGPRDDAALDETVRAYDAGAAWYADWTERFPRGSRLPDELDALAARTAGLLLDAGAGACRDSLHLARGGRTTIALDASAALLDAGDEHERLVKLHGDVRALPLPDGSIGGVWCSAVLLHLEREDVRTALGEFRRVLVDGGLLQISTKNADASHLRPIPGVTLERIARSLPEEALHQLVAAAGFTIERTWFELEPHRRGSPTRWMKVLARAT